jgi:hypothetical protein
VVAQVGTIHLLDVFDIKIGKLFDWYGVCYCALAVAFNLKARFMVIKF